MTEVFEPAEQVYHEKVLHGVLDAVVLAGSSEGAAGGMIDFPVAVDALLAAIATLAVQSQNYPTPRDARLFGEVCGKGVQKMMRGLMEAARHGPGVDWKLDRVGPAN